jgi:hypothetical protein
MRQRTAKLSTANSARQPAAGHQLAPQQIQQHAPPPGYGRGMPDYSQGGPQVSWQQPIATQQVYNQPVYQQPPQIQSRQFQQQPQIQSRQFQQQPQVEQHEGASVIHRGKIQMKDAITLITLRLAKLEEMTSTPGFHSIMNGVLDGDVDGDNNISQAMVESINDRLIGLETNMSLLFERTSDLNLQFEEMKASIQTIIDGTSIDHSDLIIQPTPTTNQDDNVDVFQNGLTQPPKPLSDNTDDNDDDDDDGDIQENNA